MFTYPFSFLGGGNLTQEAATLLLNGVDQYAVIDNSEALGNSDEGTISVWVNLSSLSTDDGKMAFISKRKNGIELSWQLGYRESGNLFEFIVYHSNGSTSVSSVSSPIVGEWYHVAGVYDESNVKLYIDGTNIETTAIGGVLNSSSALIKVGAEGDVSPSDLYNGSIAIPLVFNVAKTDAEILDLATARNPDNYSQVGMQVGIPLNTSVITPEENTIASNGDATLFGSPTYTGESLPLVTIPQVTGFSTLGLNGTTEYAEITHSSSLNLSSEMTLSIWVNLDSLGTSGSDNLLDKIISTTGYRLEYDRFFKKFGIVFYSGGVLKRVQTTTTPVTGAWYHVAGTYDGTTIKIYLNGVEENSSAFTGGIDTNTQNVTINATGSVALATIFDSALSSTRISELSIAKDPSLYTQTNLVMGLPLNAGNSSPTDDITSNGNDATLQGGAAIDGKVLSIEQASGPAEADYNTFGFDGADDYVSITDGVLSGEAEATISVWVNLDNLSDQQFYMETTSSPLTRVSFRYRNNELQLLMRDTNNGSTISTSGSSLSSGQWYHLVGVVDTVNNKLTIYINGVEDVNTSIAMNNIYSGAYNMHSNFGRRNANNDFFLNGSMAMSMVWNRALTSVEISNLYQAGKTPYYETLPSSLTSGCVMAIEMSSRDNSLNDLSGNGNNGTANGGVTDDGDLQTFASYS
ncbi:MAG: LamG domain-containing protein [Colwellia sp.]|nr:LamG domain-containing protein [Colwellia sp.]